MFLLSPLRCYLAPPLFFFRSVDCTLTNLLARALFVRASLAFVDSAGELRLFVACCLLFISLFFVRGLVHSASSHCQIVVTLYVIPVYARCLQPSLTFFDRWPRVYHFDVHVAFDREGSFLHLSVRMVLSVALCFSSLLAPAISLSDQQTQDALILVRFFMPWLRSNCIAR